MSLNFDLRAIPEEVRTIIAEADSPNSGIKKGDKIMAPITNAIIWGCLATGIGEITEKNAVEFWSRLNLWDKINGARVVGPAPEHADYYITLEDVRKHIGLRTNVFPKESEQVFLRKLMNSQLPWNSPDKFEMPKKRR